MQAGYNLVRSGLFRSVLVVGAERISETPDAQHVLNLIFDLFYERDMPLSTNTTVGRWTTGYLQRYGFGEEDLAPGRRARAPQCAEEPACAPEGRHHGGRRDGLAHDQLAAQAVRHLPALVGQRCDDPGRRGDGQRFQPRPAFINGLASRTTTYWIGDRMTPTTDADFVDFTLAGIAGRECFRLAGITDPLKQIQATEFYDPYTVMTPLQLERLGFCTRARRCASSATATGTWRAARSRSILRAARSAPTRSR